jgi:hypothetical protein
MNADKHSVRYFAWIALLLSDFFNPHYFWIAAKITNDDACRVFVFCDEFDLGQVAIGILNRSDEL